MRQAQMRVERSPSAMRWHAAVLRSGRRRVRAGREGVGGAQASCAHFAKSTSTSNTGRPARSAMYDSIADDRAPSTAVGLISLGHLGGLMGPALSLREGGPLRTSLPCESEAQGLRGAPASVIMRGAEPSFSATAPRGCTKKGSVGMMHRRSCGTVGSAPRSQPSDLNLSSSSVAGSRLSQKLRRFGWMTTQWGISALNVTPLDH